MESLQGNSRERGRVGRTGRRVSGAARLPQPNAPNFVFTLFQGNGHALFRADEIAFIVQWVKDRGAN